ncbi:multidrug ABC transporter ATP-binding protein [Halobacteriales archaeon QS_4_62_28]|nr:MAG: multidrug ABC transporter ATP-binding protein [Halobacteriales archaeon QS_4_62_28]
MSDATTIAEQADADYPLVHLLKGVGRDSAPYAVLGIVGHTLANSIGQMNALLVGLAFDSVFGSQQFALPGLPQSVVPAGTADLLWFVFGLLVAVKAVDVISALVGQWSLGVAAQRIQHDIRVAGFDAAQRLELGFFDSEATGDIMSVLNNDVNTLESFFESDLEQTVFSIVNLVSVIGFMAYLNWQLTLLLLGFVPIVIVANGWMAKLFEAAHSRQRQTEGMLNARLETSLSGIGVIKAFTGEAHESGRTAAASREHRDAGYGVMRIAARRWPINSLIAGGWMVTSFVLGGYWVLNGPPLFFTAPLSGGALLTFLLYTRTLNGPLGVVTGVVGNYKGADAAAERVVGLQQSDWQIDDDADDAADLDAVEGRVEYDDVSFAYPGTDEPVIDGVSVTVAPGETVGFVGQTGAGKSTLVKLLMRFYRPDSGTISVDGHDITTVTRESLRSRIGYVDQDPFLFDGTVRENIAYGGEGPSEEAIRQAAREARAHEFITDLPEGYDTEVGERGVKFSGGQRQRIAIARAIVDDPPILVFDEATSHVDNETEVLIQRALDRLTEDRTTVVIAHQLSSVRDADQIVVLDDGRVVEQGDHETLLDRAGTYADLWNVQVGEI